MNYEIADSDVLVVADVQNDELSYGPLRHDHCIQGTTGVQFHAGLQVLRIELILRKGYRRNIDAYSVHCRTAEVG
jgi:hypothetical protein